MTDAERVRPAAAESSAIAPRYPAAASDARDRASVSATGRRPADPLPLILHLVTDLRLGGTQAILLERVRRSGPIRHAVLCYSTRTGGARTEGTPDLTAAFGHAGVPVYHLGLATPGEAVMAALTGRLAGRVDEVLTATQPSLIHSTLFHVHLLGAWMARRAGVPHVASKEGIDEWMGPLHRWLESRALRAATRVTAVSQATARAVLRLGVEASRLEVIPNGIDPARPGNWVVPPPASAGSYTSIRSPADSTSPAAGPRLVGVGRLDPAKGWDDLLDAMALLQAAHPGVYFDLLGSGTEAEGHRLRERAASRGLTNRVRIRVDASSRLGPAESQNGTVGEPLPHPEPSPDRKPPPQPILVVPSREEGFGLVLLEGMARGLPIVATRAGGIPEVARHGLEALLVPPRDPRALAEAIAQVHADPALATRLVQGGRTRVADFPVGAMVDAYHRLYAELLAVRPAALTSTDVNTGAGVSTGASTGGGAGAGPDASRDLGDPAR